MLQKEEMVKSIYIEYKKSFLDFYIINLGGRGDAHFEMCFKVNRSQIIVHRFKYVCFLYSAWLAL